MDDQLRHTLNDKFDAMRSGDAFPDFDRLDTWNAIERQLEPARAKSIPFPAWRLAAAATLTGALLGAFAVRYIRQDPKQQPAFSHHFGRQTPPRSERPDSPALTTAAPAIESPALPGKRTNSRMAAARTQPAPRMPDTAAAQPVIAGNTPVPTVAPGVTAPGSRPRARHLLDIDAGSRAALLHEQSSGPGNASVSQYFMVRSMASQRASEAPAAIVPRHW